MQDLAENLFRSSTVSRLISIVSLIKQTANNYICIYILVDLLVHSSGPIRTLILVDVWVDLSLYGGGGGSSEPPTESP